MSGHSRRQLCLQASDDGVEELIRGKRGCGLSAEDETEEEREELEGKKEKRREEREMSDVLYDAFFGLNSAFFLRAANPIGATNSAALRTMAIAGPRDTPRR